MSDIYTSADQLIGKTPLLELTHIEKKFGLKARVLAKLEYFNPAENVKEIDLHNVKIEGYEGERLRFANVGHFEED